MTTQRKGLGTGFDSLIPTNFDTDLLLEKEDRIQKLFITDLKPNTEQPRKHFDEQAIKELSESIKQYGILQPLIVVPKGNEYIIVAGERRFRAASLAGLKTVPAIVRGRAELEQLEVALIENVQRVDLSPIEQAISIEKLHQQFNVSYADIAKRLSKAVSTINNIVRLLQLPADAREALQKQEISEGHARAILSLKNQPTQQAALLKHILNENWSVRQAERFVVGLKQTGADNKIAHTRTKQETPETKQLAKNLAVKVTIQHTARGGRLELHFKDETELKTIIEKLSSL